MRRIALVVLTVGALLAPGEAHAYIHTVADCPDTNNRVDNIVRGNKPGGSWMKTATGAIGGFLQKTRDWGGCNADTVVYGSGVMVVFVDASGNLTDKYVWMGYDEYFSELGPGWGPSWEGWGKWGPAFERRDWVGGSCYGSCMISLGGAPGVRCYYKTNVVEGSTDWKMWVRCGGDGTYHLMGTIYDTGYSRGVPMSVTFRLGGSRTGMSDDINSLQYRSPTGTWKSWSANSVYNGLGSNPTDWKASSVKATSYQVVKV